MWGRIYTGIRLRRWRLRGVYAYDDGRSMERPYKAVGITWHWASHGMWIPGGGTDIHADRLTTMATTRGDTLTAMATTRGYAYDDGRSMERPYKAVGITRHWVSHGMWIPGGRTYTRIGLRRWRRCGDTLTTMRGYAYDDAGIRLRRCGDTLTTMATTRGYAYDDGRSDCKEFATQRIILVREPMSKQNTKHGSKAWDSTMGRRILKRLLLNSMREKRLLTSIPKRHSPLFHI